MIWKKPIGDFYIFQFYLGTQFNLLDTCHMGVCVFFLYILIYGNGQVMELHWNRVVPHFERPQVGWRHWREVKANGLRESLESETTPMYIKNDKNDDLPVKPLFPLEI